MPMTVLAFGPLTDLTGTPSLTLDDVPDTDALRKVLQIKFPGLNQLSYAIAVDKIVVRENTPLRPSSIVALLPPFSGG